MTTPTVEVVIAVHDESRPLGRAVDSVLDGRPEGVGVLVVLHGLGPDAFSTLRTKYEDEPVTWLEFHDGVRSAAGPFTAGIHAATADYVGLLGSDDRFERGALATMVRRLELDRPDALVYPMRHDGMPPLPNPLVRWRRERRLHPVRDRLAYRTAPLALFRRSLVDRLGLRFTPGVATGEDAEFSARLWFSGARIDFHPADPGYVIMADAATRVTMTPRPLEEDLEAYSHLFALDWVGALSPSERHALAVKTVRVHVLGAVLARAAREQLTADDIAAARAVVEEGIRLAPGLLAPFSRADRPVLAALLDPSSTPARFAALNAARAGAGRLRRWFPTDLRHALDREGSLRRLMRYATWPKAVVPGGGR
jgi:hypothetical protein